MIISRRHVILYLPSISAAVRLWGGECPLFPPGFRDSYSIRAR